MRIETVEAIAISIPLGKDFGGATYHAGLGVELDRGLVERYRVG